MPILKLEPCVYPECLLAGELAADIAADRKWWVLYTKPRQEKALARELFNSDVPFYLPLVPKRVVYRGRRVESRLPLFGGYVFLFGTDDERFCAICTNRISQLVNVPDPEGLANDLRRIYRLIESDAAIEFETQLTPGRRVRVKTGPLAGLEGTVEACKSGYRLIIGVQLLQRGVSLEIDDACLEPI